MKKAFKIVAVAVVVAVLGFANLLQAQVDTNFKSKTGMPLEYGKKAYLMNKNKVYFNGDTLQPGEAAIKMIYVIGGSVKVTSMPVVTVTKVGVDTTLVMEYGAKNFYMYYDTVGISGRDSVSRRIDLADTCNNLKYFGFIRNAQWKISSNDTLIYSTSSTFTANKTGLLYPFDANMDNAISLTTATNIYYRKLGTGGNTTAATVRVWIWEK